MRSNAKVSQSALEGKYGRGVHFRKERVSTPLVSAENLMAFSRKPKVPKEVEVGKGVKVWKAKVRKTQRCGNPKD